MTEQEWLAGTDGIQMLRAIRVKATHRKGRLFAAACYRRLWNWLTEECRDQVEILEGEAEKIDPKGSDLGESFEYAIDVARRAAPGNIRGAFEAAILAICGYFEVPAVEEVERQDESNSAWVKELNSQANLVREIIGNPFRPVAFDPAWRTPSVTAVAQAIYAERRFADLPILADALEEADCSSGALLAHCRSGGDHVRGCWAVDLVLEKE